MIEAIDRYFKVTKSGSTIKTEIFSGFTAYFTVAYIIFLVPATLMSIFPEAFDESGNMIGSFVLESGVTANEMLVSLTIAACIASAVGTFIMAFTTNLPFAQGPSLAIGTFVAFTICKKMGYTYNEALAAVFLAGIVFFILSMTGVEQKVQNAIPGNIKFAVTAGIGLFIAFMGMQKAHIIEGSSSNLVQLVNFADFSSSHTRSALLCLLGIVVITIMLIEHIHGAILWGKLLCIGAAIPLGLISTANVAFSNYSISLEPTLFKLDFIGLFTAHNNFGFFGVLVSVGVIIASLFVMDVFETIGTIIATDYIITYSHDGNCVTDKLPNILRADASATSLGGLLGITNISTNVESTSMVLEGGRTGLCGVVAGVLFLLTIFIAPYASVIPSAATATTLIMAGILMMNVIKYINFDDIEEALPAFLTMFLMPLTYSLVTGIAMGLISYTAIKYFSGKGDQVSPGTYIIAFIFVLQFILTQG